MPDAGEEVLAFPDTQARLLAGVSMRRLRYWEQVGLIVLRSNAASATTTRCGSILVYLCAVLDVAEGGQRDQWCATAAARLARPGWVDGCISQATMSDGETVHSEQVQLAVPDVVNAAQDLV